MCDAMRVGFWLLTFLVLCVDHSAIVARKCRVWIEDVVAKDLA